MQGAHETIELLQTQVLDLEIQLSQAKATVADSQHASTQNIAKLQDRLHHSELKAASKSDSDSGLRALTAEIAQLRGELEARVKEAAAAAATSEEAASAARVINLQGKLQQAEAKAAANAEAHSKLTEMTKELMMAQSHATQLESSAAEAEEEHRAALQVGLQLACSHACVLHVYTPSARCALVCNQPQVIPCRECMLHLDGLIFG